MTSVQIRVLMSPNHIVPAAITYCEDDNDEIHLVIEFENVKEEVTANDCFTALTEVRKALEKKHAVPLVLGADRRVYPSPMQQQMGCGTTAYVQHWGEPAKSKDIVDIFDPAKPDDVTTVKEQLEYHEKWKQSVLLSKKKDH